MTGWDKYDPSMEHLLSNPGLFLPLAPLIIADEIGCSYETWRSVEVERNEFLKRRTTWIGCYTDESGALRWTDGSSDDFDVPWANLAPSFVDSLGFIEPAPAGVRCCQVGHDFMVGSNYYDGEFYQTACEATVTTMGFRCAR